MLKNAGIFFKLLIFSKRSFLTILLILFSIGSYTFSEISSSYVPSKVDQLNNSRVILTRIKSDFPISYVKPISYSFTGKIVKIDLKSLRLNVPSERVMDVGRISAKDLAKFLSSHNNNVDESYAHKLAEIYISEAAKEGVNPELAFAQMCLETGFLRFDGTVNKKQNNFCGLGVTGNGVVGLSFETEEEGIRAHIQHLKAYGSTEDLNAKLIDSRFNLVKRGSGKHLKDLTGKWAMDKKYDKKIRSLLGRLFNMTNNNTPTTS